MTKMMCTTDDCQICGGTGWIECDHIGTEREYDPFNEDGFTEWCTRCDSAAGIKVRCWCPNREG